MIELLYMNATRHSSVGRAEDCGLSEIPRSLVQIRMTGFFFNLYYYDIYVTIKIILIRVNSISWKRKQLLKKTLSINEKVWYSVWIEVMFVHISLNYWFVFFLRNHEKKERHWYLLIQIISLNDSFIFHLSSRLDI